MLRLAPSVENVKKNALIIYLFAKCSKKNTAF